MTKEMWQLARMHELKDFGERLSHYENDEMLIDEVDEGFCNMMGYTQSELMIRSCGKVGDLIYPPDYEEIRYQIRKNLKQSGSYTCRYRMRKKDGSLIWVWENGRYEKDDTGRKNIRSLVVDVSREEKTMRERDTTYDNIPGGVMTVLVTDTNFYIMEANHQYFTMVGTTREQYLGSSGIYYRGFAATSLSRQENRNRLITIFVPGILVIRIQDGTGWSADIIRKAKRDASIYVRFWMSRNRNVRCTA